MLGCCCGCCVILMMVVGCIFIGHPPRLGREHLESHPADLLTLPPAGAPQLEGDGGPRHLIVPLQILELVEVLVLGQSGHGEGDGDVFAHLGPDVGHVLVRLQRGRSLTQTDCVQLYSTWR